ncbi:uncharacterized protein LOC132799395 [Ziziphus jujuba]|uniref:Uncharacterized protein LOC132799395 n=1 Tax=Ziziphus jujuba TaxID=326968 RepID=A0ABM3ZRS8_ZIZJJ|nr:uncharacterized protein LOC132799395 [Ziziphus jujuba]
MKQCQKNPYNVDEKKQKTITFDRKSDGSGSNLVANIFNKEACRMACAKTKILDELPFSFVEGRGFRHFCSVACPKFDPPSRRTILRDIYQLYLDKKLALSYRMLYDTDQSMVTELTNGLKKTLMRLYNWYNEKEMGLDSSCQSSTRVESSGTSLDSNSSGLEQANYAD